MAGPYGQVRAVGVERKPEIYELSDDVGPSVLFFGRPVFGAGLLTIVNDEGHGRVDNANAFSREYGLSLYSRESIVTARHSGSEVFLRIGYLLDVLPGPRESEPWPALRTLPTDLPWGQWCPAACPPRFGADEGFDPF